MTSVDATLEDISLAVVERLLLSLLDRAEDPSAAAWLSAELRDAHRQADGPERMALLVAACRAGRLLFDSADQAAPGSVLEPAPVDWDEHSDSAEPSALSGVCDAMTMLCDSGDLGADRKWSGYGGEACDPVRYAAAVSTALGYALQTAQTLGDGTAQSPGHYVRGVIAVLKDAAAEQDPGPTPDAVR